MSKMMKVNTGVQLTDMDGLSRFAIAARDSGLFKTGTDVAKAIVVMQLGMELGLGPVTALQGIYTVGGKPAMSAQLMGTLVKRAGYRFKPKTMTDELVEIEFFEQVDGKWEVLGLSSFSMDDAKQAGLDGANYRKFPRNMLWARAMANGARWFCGDALGGAPQYTPDELGIDVDEEGDPIAVEVVEETVTVEEPEEEPTEFFVVGAFKVPVEEWEPVENYVRALRTCETEDDLQGALNTHGRAMKGLSADSKAVGTWEYRLAMATAQGDQARVDRIMTDAKLVFDALDDALGESK